MEEKIEIINDYEDLSKEDVDIYETEIAILKFNKNNKNSFAPKEVKSLKEKIKDFLNKNN